MIEYSCTDAILIMNEWRVLEPDICTFLEWNVNDPRNLVFCINTSESIQVLLIWDCERCRVIGMPSDQGDGLCGNHRTGFGRP